MQEKVIERCVICETPYNIFNAVKYFLGNGLNNSTDLYIGKNLEYLYENLERVAIFKSVTIFVNDIDLNASKVEKIKHLLSVKKSISDSLPLNTIKKKYHSIYVFSATKFPSEMIYANPEAEVFYIEDGMDSYIGRIWSHRSVSKKRKLINFISGRKIQRLKPQKVLLNEPDLYDGKQDYIVLPIGGEISKNALVNETLKKIYSYKPTDFYDDKNIFYLGQAFIADRIDEDIGSVENEIGKMLAECKQKVLYRKHPRETSFSSDWAYVDDGTAMWELVCQEHLSDDSVLISPFSTAMLTPKLLYNKEPWLIYTYKLYKNYFVEDNPMTCGLNQGISVMVEQIKKVYSRPEKIICVQNIKEIKDTLEMIEIE